MKVIQELEATALVRINAEQLLDGYVCSHTIELESRHHKTCKGAVFVVSLYGLGLVRPVALADF